MLELRTAPGRADWLVLATATATTLHTPSFPNVGNVDEALCLLRDLLFEKVSRSYSVPRLALGLNAMHPAVDRDASYEELVNLLSTIRPNVAGATEFQYQINRPRRSTSVPDLMINRLSRWSSVVMTGITIPVLPTQQVPLSSASIVQTKPIYATRVELDLSSTAERRVPIPTDARLDLLQEFSRLASEILQSGDIQ